LKEFFVSKVVFGTSAKLHKPHQTHAQTTGASEEEKNLLREYFQVQNCNVTFLVTLPQTATVF